MCSDYIPTIPENPEELDNVHSDQPLHGRYEVGHKLLGRYKVRSFQEGGFGIVYFVRDEISGEEYAAKTYKPELKDSVTHVENFKKEIVLWLGLKPHPHLVMPHIVELIDEQPYLFMEYIHDGFHKNLKNLITDRKNKLEWQTAIKLGYQICSAMEFINRKQEKIVHADLKPENIMITKEGNAKVTDFGTSEFFNYTGDLFPIQTTGTLEYMPPEQLRGQIVDQQSDIFSFGILLYEMVAFQLPYPTDIYNDSSLSKRESLLAFYDKMGEEFHTDAMHLTPWKKVLKNNKLAPSLKELILGCLIPQRSNRWQSFLKIQQFMEHHFEDQLEDTKMSTINVNLHNKALSYFRLGLISQSLSTFNQAIIKDPDNAPLWHDAEKALLHVDEISNFQTVSHIAREKPPVQEWNTTSIDEMSNQIQILVKETRFQTALELLLKALDKNSENKDVNYLTSLTIFLSQDSGHTYNARERLTNNVLGDTRLDHLFCECAECKSTWVPNPMTKNFSLVWSYSPPGGQCPNCARVYCRDCASKPGGTSQVCPKCDMDLTLINEPNGRTSRQSKFRSEPLYLVVVFREGPIHPDGEYLNSILSRYIPESIEQNSIILARAIFPWSLFDATFINELKDIFLKYRISKNTHQVDHILDFTDENGIRLYFLKFYNKYKKEEKKGKSRYDQAKKPQELELLALIEVYHSFEVDFTKKQIATHIINEGKFEDLLEYGTLKEKEKVLLEVSKDANYSNKDVIEGLTKVGTKDTFSRLLFYLRYAEDYEHSWRLTLESFKKNNTLILSSLLDLLKAKDKYRKKEQARGRKRLLILLNEIGDMSCIPVIEVLLATDSANQKLGREVIQSIKDRSNN
ncbi:MAG: serine/threonine protein kinase [Chloroflexi bacterium]|nr:MAG: serine/threonine protein kinase [Chloroflexota bacterium]